MTFSARNPQLHRIITQESKADGARMDYLVEHHVRPLYESTVALFEHLVRDGVVPDIPPAHLYYILTGAGPTMFVLAPECRRLTGLDPESDDGDRGARRRGVHAALRSDLIDDGARQARRPRPLPARALPARRSSAPATPSPTACRRSRSGRPRSTWR